MSQREFPDLQAFNMSQSIPLSLTSFAHLFAKFIATTLHIAIDVCLQAKSVKKPHTHK